MLWFPKSDCFSTLHLHLQTCFIWPANCFLSFKLMAIVLKPGDFIWKYVLWQLHRICSLTEKASALEAQACIPTWHLQLIWKEAIPLGQVLPGLTTGPTTPYHLPPNPLHPFKLSERQVSVGIEFATPDTFQPWYFISGRIGNLERAVTCLRWLVN